MGGGKGGMIPLGSYDLSDPTNPWIADRKRSTESPTATLDIVEVLSLSTNTWRSGPKLTRERSWLTMEVLDNNLVVFGGYGGVADSLEILEGEDWREELLQYGHVEHASVSIPC